MSQIAIADFNNPMGLEKVGETSLPRVRQLRHRPGRRRPARAAAAPSSAASLEMSNVDLAAEFTNLILAQRGFQASSRVITTSDQVLEDLVNIKR